jgi:hypothetical protein
VTSVFAQRASYQRQGIRFDGGALPFFAERKVSSAFERRLSRDHLFVSDGDADFVGTWRGSRVQLYAVSRRAIEAIVNPKVAGSLIDRDTAARHSFGQLSPGAITFSSATQPQFRERKRNLILATSSASVTSGVIDRHVTTLRGRGVDLRPSVTACIRDAIAEAVWGDDAWTPVRYLDRTGSVQSLPFAEAMYDNFLRLRKFANGYMIRVEPRLQHVAWTREQRWMRANVRELQRHMSLLAQPPFGDTIAGHIGRLHTISGFSADIIRDDTATSFIAAVDTTRTAILATLKHVLNPVNATWRSAEPAIVRACVTEAMRVDTPGSVFNGRVTSDFQLTVGDTEFRMHRNTLVMPNLHALHASYGAEFDPGRLLAQHASELVIPFGKGPRLCPGRSFASQLVATYVAAFLRAFPGAQLDPSAVENGYPVHTSSEHGLFVNF